MINWPNLEQEQRCWRSGYGRVVGVDEVGRGALAGPVVAAAVSFAQNHKPIPGIADSKQVRAKQRFLLAPKIQQEAQSWGIGIVPACKIDAMGIANATYLAMNRALEACIATDYVLIDGNIMPKLVKSIVPNGKSIIKGDQRVYSIAAASIIAKVCRDQLMINYHPIYPQYLWDTNKGYGTKAHFKAIAKRGVTPYHRLSFLENMSL